MCLRDLSIGASQGQEILEKSPLRGPCSACSVSTRGLWDLKTSKLELLKGWRSMRINGHGRCEGLRNRFVRTWEASGSTGGAESAYRRQSGLGREVLNEGQAVSCWSQGRQLTGSAGSNLPHLLRWQAPTAAPQACDLSLTCPLHFG